MKNYINNTGYFIRETKTMIQLNLVSNIFSVFSISLIFFILTTIISAWWISSEVVNVIQDEAEISIYFDENIKSSQAVELVGKVKNIDGVKDAILVDENEAYDRMVEILGKEARVLEFFDDNPFSSFIEVKINLEEMNKVLEKLDIMTDIDHIRDNREVLDRISNISEVLRILGYLVIAAAGISTVVIISHIIKMGIYNGKEQINTLRLLGAPEFFIAFPYLLEGMLLTLCGGILATTLAAYSVEYVYVRVVGPLPFIPLPSKETLVSSLVLLITSLSVILGVVGSMMGISSAKGE